MSISFNNIPVTVRVPGHYIEIVPNQSQLGLFGLPTQILVIGQMRASGTLTPGAPVQVTTAGQAATLAGAGSMLAQMAAAVLAGCQGALPVYIAGVADTAAGVAATGTVTIGGAATGAGTLALYVGGRAVQTLVNAGDSAATIAANMLLALAQTVDLPASATINGAAVTLTANHKGLCGNDIDVRVNYNTGDATPAGITVTVTPLSGGTANPSITPVLDAIGGAWFTDIVMPWTDAVNLGSLESFLATEYGPLVMKDGLAWAAIRGTFGTCAALGQSRNSPHVSILGVPASPSLTWEWAASVAGVAAYYLSIDPARPLQTLPLPVVLAPALADRFTWEERNLLLYEGVSTFDVDGGGSVSIERCITTYQTGAFGAVDTSYLNVETLRTVAYLRYDTQCYLSVMFPRYKLADDGTVFGVGQAIVTPKTIKGALINRFAAWQDAGLVENPTAFVSGLVVQRNGSDPCRVDALIPPDIVAQLRVIAAQISFSQ